MSDERVYVVPRAAVPDAAGWYGLRTDGLDDVRGRPRARRPVRAARRDGARSVVQAGHPVPRLARRAALLPDAADDAGADARLHGRYSIGVGGHLNPGDGGLLGGLEREWREELVADFVPAFRLIALLNDDTTEVGAVHLGAVYVAEADGRPVAIRETDKLTGGFAEPCRGGRRDRPDGDVEQARLRVAGRRRVSRRRTSLIRRAIAASLAAVVSVVTLRALAGRGARRLLDAPRTTPFEEALRPALDALGGEVVRFGSRDGLRLRGRWLPAQTTQR